MITSAERYRIMTNTFEVTQYRSISILLVRHIEPGIQELEI